MCCVECFEMLFYDAQGKPLKGELAGEGWPASHFAAGTNQESMRGRAAPAGGDGGGGGGGGEEAEPEEFVGPKGWTVYNCYDEC